MIVLEQNTKRTYLFWPVALAAGLLCTFCIVWLMTQLITPQEVNTKVYKLLSIDFIQIDKLPTLVQNDPVNETQPPLPANIPKVLDGPKLNIQTDEVSLAPMELVPIDQPTIDIEIDVPDIAATELNALPSIQKAEPTFDQDLYPILTNDPIYPSRAKRAKIEGWVNVAFTITVDGKVTGIEILAAEPEGVFENSTLNALKNWHFKPQILSGKAQERRVVQTIQFELQK